jgi:hypothetical protein
MSLKLMLCLWLSQNESTDEVSERDDGREEGEAALRHKEARSEIATAPKRHESLAGETRLHAHQRYVITNDTFSNV